MRMAGADLSGLRDYFKHFADVHVAASSPLYAVLARKVARDDALLTFAAQATPGQPAANLLFAAVQYVLREAGDDEPLRSYYPTLGGTRAAHDGDPAALFEDFVWRHQDRLLPLFSTKITNTNEVGRCGVLVAGFKRAAMEAGEALHMIELGPSVGLNLSWDRFYYRHGAVEMGPKDSPVRIAPELRGAMPSHLDGLMPEVASRCGIELNPAPVADEETLRWQLALIFPEHVDRARRLEGAFAIARDLQPRIIEGDAVARISEVIEGLPPGGAVCVYHSQTTYQIPPARRAELSDRLMQAGRVRPIWRVGFEWLDGARGQASGDHVLGLARYREGSRSYQHVAFCDPHGRWLEWGPEPAEETDRL
jgi:hypothetical protein